ncbi:hypothetical protein [Massilia horti]|uniref:DUF2314 domain-containing protein n=1 Tax=Massilia horti TaxID=2562153 RepID=A0A4Y9SQN0_9BURK|nr:hypothetical protein [Massilia horti]TFW27659.1 hypothetical protein E4O92_23420 [Massilia horti]
MRFPKIDVDYWTLVSGEDRHRSSPETFWIPPFEERQALQPGDAAKLIFEIESEDEFGEISRDCERMWVVVSEVRPLYFIGRVTNMPVGCNDSSFYLTEDAEVPFLPEHVIDIDRPPKEFLDALFSESPKKLWPR